MYGTIARLKAKPDRVEALQQMTAAGQSPGWYVVTLSHA